MTARSISVSVCLAAALVAAWSAPAFATYTTVGPPASGEASHEAIFEGVYGGDFIGSGTDLGNGLWTVFSNGTVTATRVDDDGFTPLLDLYDGYAGSGDDDLWTDGATTATAEARFAGQSQEFGYDDGFGYVKLFDATGTGFGVTGSGTCTFPAETIWEWARADDSDGGLLNPHYSEEASNNDGLDHMVTYHLTGVPGLPSTTNVWAVFFEDVSGGGSDRDFNDLMVELSAVECVADDDCSDDLACTDDTCDTDTGVCIFTPVDCTSFDDACQIFSCDPNGGDGNCDIATDRTDCEQFDNACQIFTCDLNGAEGNCNIATDRTDCSQYDNACQTFSCDLDGAKGNCDIATDRTDCSLNDTNCETFECDLNGADGNCAVVTPTVDCSVNDNACQTFSCDPNGTTGNCDIATDRVDCAPLNTHCDRFACDPGGAIGNCSEHTLLCGACCLQDGSCVDDVWPTECVGLGSDFIDIGTACLGDNNGDGYDDICPPRRVIPTVSEWGLIVMTLLGLAMGAVVFGRRVERRAV